MIPRSLRLLWGTAACGCTDLGPVCVGKVCIHSISMEVCFGGLRGKEGSQYLILSCAIAGPPWSRLGQHISHWPLSLHQEPRRSVWRFSWWCNRGRRPDVYGCLGSAVMWMSVTVTCVYKYKVLFLFNITDYSRFFKSVFFPRDPLYLASPLLCPAHASR